MGRGLQPRMLVAKTGSCRHGLETRKERKEGGGGERDQNVQRSLKGISRSDFFSFSFLCFFSFALPKILTTHRQECSVNCKTKVKPLQQHPEKEAVPQRVPQAGHGEPCSPDTTPRPPPEQLGCNGAKSLQTVARDRGFTRRHGRCRGYGGSPSTCLFTKLHL